MKSIILAGGSGSRLWPLSRDMYPKQLFAFDSGESLLQQTYSRLMSLSDVSDIVTITNVKLYPDIKLQLNKINDKNVIISEPVAKNTAPAIACTLEYFKQKYKDDDIVLIVPSDHLIKNIEDFEKTIKTGEKLAKGGLIVTFGIKPGYPETGYGYIKAGETLLKGYRVEKFIEKPDYESAKKYTNSDGYYWNSGIFMGKISVFSQELAKYASDIYSEAESLDFSKDNKIPYCIYENMPSISIDYALMEKTDKLVLVELLSDWKDLGSWKSLYEIQNKDDDGNVISGKVITNNVKNSFVYSQKEVVAISDMEDVAIVETEDAIMACKLSDSQNVKYLYEKLKSTQSGTTNLHKTVFRPWGYYTCMNSGDGYLTKTICVLPKQKLSLQSHDYRSEHWVVLEGEALVIKGDKEYHLNPGESIDIQIKEKHSLQNPYDKELKIIEVQQGDYISEEDITRYQDVYGRV